MTPAASGFSSPPKTAVFLGREAGKLKLELVWSSRGELISGTEAGGGTVELPLTAERSLHGGRKEGACRGDN